MLHDAGRWSPCVPLDVQRNVTAKLKTSKQFLYHNLYFVLKQKIEAINAQVVRVLISLSLHIRLQFRTESYILISSNLIGCNWT